jgi:outer membrane lipoprotein SlyB
MGTNEMSANSLNVAGRTHPLVITAAVAVTLFSAVGIAAVMGWLPTSTGQTPPAQAPIAVTESKTSPAAVAAREPAPAPKPVARSRPAPKQVVAESTPMPYPLYPPVYDAPSTPAPVIAQAPTPLPAVEPAKAVCNDCGVIEAVFANQKQDSASGAGAAAGGVLGGVLGHQMGNGRGRDLMTAVGAIGGAIAGHQIEKSRRASTTYEIVVRFEDGTTRRFNQAEQPSWRSGDRVRVVDGAIRAI